MVKRLKCNSDVVMATPGGGCDRVMSSDVVTHAAAASGAPAASRAPNATTERAEDRRPGCFGDDVPDQATCRFIPFSVESCGYMGKAAVSKVK